VVQKTLQNLEIRLVAERELNADELETLGEFLTGQLKHPFNYSYSYHETLKRGRNGKFEDFVSELDN
jgi:hypothetical protein